MSELHALCQGLSDSLDALAWSAANFDAIGRSYVSLQNCDDGASRHLRDCLSLVLEHLEYDSANAPHDAPSMVEFAKPWSQSSSLPCNQWESEKTAVTSLPSMSSTTSSFSSMTSSSSVSCVMPGRLPSAKVASGCHTARTLMGDMLRLGVPAKLVASLSDMDFEARKTATKVFTTVLRLGVELDIEEQLVEHVLGHREIFLILLEGCGDRGVLSLCAEMLRACAWYPQFVEALLKADLLGTLLSLAAHQSFDISSEAFGSLQEIAFSQPALTSAYLEVKFAEYFGLFHMLLEGDNYATERQALRLLSLMLLNGSFMHVMAKYVSDAEFLKIHMKLLQSSSTAIQLDSFHVFKIFVFNPNKPDSVQKILHRNKARLLKLLKQSFDGRRDFDEHFVQDLQVVLDLLEGLEPAC